MSNPESFLKRIEQLYSTLKPRPEKFSESVYPKEEVARDLTMLSTYQQSPEYQRGEERSDSVLLEKTFIHLSEIDDWFQEEDRFGDDENEDYESIVAIPSSEVDDTFGHIDVIGTIRNADTDYERMHFAIDLTYNTDSEKLGKKFSWLHLHGLKDNAPKGVSEFGDIITDRGFDGRQHKRTRPLRNIFRRGLKIPGFASAKYYEDTNNTWDPAHDKGRIDVMPRLVVGYSPELAEILAQGPPDESIARKYGMGEYEKRMNDFNTAKTRAKWCALNECAEQASAIHFMVDNLPESKTESMDKDELESARKQAAAMDKYFSGALEQARKKAAEDPQEQEAMDYAERDEVRNEIQLRTGFTFIDPYLKKKESVSSSQPGGSDEQKIA